MLLVYLLLIAACTVLTVRLARRRSRQAVTAVAVTLLVLGAACTRHEYRRDRCPPMPPSRSAIAWQVVPSDSLVVAGRVVAVDSARPLEGAETRPVQPAATTRSERSTTAMSCSGEFG